MRKRWPFFLAITDGLPELSAALAGEAQKRSSGATLAGAVADARGRVPAAAGGATTSGRRITGTYSTPESRSSSIPRDVSAASRSGLGSAFFPGSFHRPQSVKPVGPRSRSHRSHDLVDEACQRRLPGARRAVAAQHRRIAQISSKVLQRFADVRASSARP